MENYESNDCESLGEYAAEYISILMDYFRTYVNEADAAKNTIYCAFYFLNIDNFVDGGEEDVLRYAIDDWDYKYNIPLMQKNFQSRNYSSYVEDLMISAPRQIKEVFARLGCALCSGKGYISSQEREVIKRWIY